jgi:hypothetical protein
LLGARATILFQHCLELRLNVMAVKLCVLRQRRSDGRGQIGVAMALLFTVEEMINHAAKLQRQEGIRRKISALVDHIESLQMK